MSHPVLYTISEVADVLGVHYETVARWVRTGKLRGIKLSRRKVVIPKEQLDALFSSGASPVAAKPSSMTGSPQRWLTLVRTLTSQEAKKLRNLTQDFEKVDEAD
jgi:excisionase family DNA binding protein